MATVGNLALTQLRMAQAMTNYGMTGSNNGTTTSSSSTTSSTAAKETLDNLLNTTLKNKSDYFKEQYSNLYKSIYGITDDAEAAADSAVSLKTAASAVQSTADKLTDFAKNLKYGEEYDVDEYSDLAQKFADSYNSMIEKAGDSDNTNVLQKGVIMVNTAKVFSASLSRAGFTLGSDNKLTFDKDKLSEVDATDIKTTFGTMGFSEKTSQKAQQINSLSGSLGAFAYTNASTQSYAYSIGALFSIYA